MRSFFFFYVRKVMCRCRKKVWREAHITQQHEHPVITLMNYKRMRSLKFSLWSSQASFHSFLSTQSSVGAPPTFFHSSLFLSWYFPLLIALCLVHLLQWTLSSLSADIILMHLYALKLYYCLEWKCLFSKWKSEWPFTVLITIHLPITTV